METLKMKLAVAINLISICMILIFTAMPANAAEDYKQACSESLIDDSFKQILPTEIDVKDLQTRLKSGEFMTGSVNGKLNNKTLEGLHKFCLHIGPDEKSIPLSSPKNPTAELANFLIKKLAEFKPDETGQGPDTSDKDKSKGEQDPSTVVEAAKDDKPPMPCESAAIAQSFATLKGKEEAVQKIQILLKSGGYLTDRADRLLGPETYQALGRLCQYMTDTGLLKVETEGDLAVVDALKKRLSEEELGSLLQMQTSEISLAATADCGCSREFSALVYGFLPYWLADGTPQVVDFSMLKRIGFHALTLNEGELVSDSLWSKGGRSESHIAKFISLAHRHRVKVDITFYTSDWMNWDSGKVESAAKAIARTAKLEFSDSSDDGDAGANLANLLRKLLPFVEDNSSVQADGINLYFDNYESAGDADEIISIVEAVAIRLPDTTINIMLGLDWVGIKEAAKSDLDSKIRDPYQQLFRKLKPVLEQKPDRDADADSPANVVAGKVENLFIFLPRNTPSLPKNTSNSKKLLRLAIEDAFNGDGATRRTVLRKIVPIIPTSSDAVDADYFEPKAQFVEDLIYLQDNFAGVGLWPLPMTPAEVARGDDDKNDDEAVAAAPEKAAPESKVASGYALAIGERLQQEYEIKSGLRQLSPELAFFAGQLCEFACPNRWLFRLTFDVLAALLGIYALLAVGNCRLREIYQEKFRYFLGYGLGTASIFTVSLICDPFWQEVLDFVLVGFVVALSGFTGFRYFRKSMQPKYP